MGLGRGRKAPRSRGPSAARVAGGAGGVGIVGVHGANLRVISGLGRRALAGAAIARLVERPRVPRFSKQSAVGSRMVAGIVRRATDASDFLQCLRPSFDFVAGSSRLRQPSTGRDLGWKLHESALLLADGFNGWRSRRGIAEGRGFPHRPPPKPGPNKNSSPTKKWPSLFHWRSSARDEKPRRRTPRAQPASPTQGFGHGSPETRGNRRCAPKIAEKTA